MRMLSELVPAHVGLSPCKCFWQIDRQDPAPEAMRIYLHAFRYRGPTFDFQTAMPWWSGEDWPQQLAERQETY